MTEQIDYRGRPRVQTINDLPSETIQSESDQTDIKKILKKYREVGIIEHLNLTESTFADVTSFTDYGDVIRTAKEAELQFMQLPSKIREKFNHDTALWLDTAHDEAKRLQLLEEGTIKTLEPPAKKDPPADVPPTPPSGDPDPTPTED